MHALAAFYGKPADPQPGIASNSKPPAP